MREGHTLLKNLHIFLLSLGGAPPAEAPPLRRHRVRGGGVLRAVVCHILPRFFLFLLRAQAPREGRVLRVLRCPCHERACTRGGWVHRPRSVTGGVLARPLSPAGRGNREYPSPLRHSAEDPGAPTRPPCGGRILRSVVPVEASRPEIFHLFPPCHSSTKSLAWITAIHLFDNPFHHLGSPLCFPLPRLNTPDTSEIMRRRS